MDVAVNPFGGRAGVPEPPFLAADIGGTHARIALVEPSPDADCGIEVLDSCKFACADFPGVVELLLAFTGRGASVPVRRCVLACAGQAMDGEVLSDNLAWPINLARVRAALDLDDVAILNDFEALGHALGGIPARTGRLLCGPDGLASGAALVIGPGTGLGAAVRIPGAADGGVLTTEAGQMDFAPHTLREREILACLVPDGGYLPYERVVSGPGLLALYTTLCTMLGAPPRCTTPEAVTHAATTHADAQAVEAVEIFCGALGSFAGGLAMAFMASGGVYLAGGFLHAMFELLGKSGFEQRFLHGRSVRAFLSRIPVRVMEHGRYGVLGAASWYVRHAGSGAAARRLAASGLAA